MIRNPNILIAATTTTNCPKLKHITIVGAYLLGVPSIMAAMMPLALLSIFCVILSFNPCLAQLTQAEQNTILLPGPTCSAACASSAAEGIFYLECGACYLDNNLFNPPDISGLQRFPLYELNFTAQPAIPVAEPVAYSQENVRFTALVS